MEENLVPIMLQKAAARPNITAAIMPPVSTARAAAPAVEDALAEAVGTLLAAVFPEPLEAAKAVELIPETTGVVVVT